MGLEPPKPEASAPAAVTPGGSAPPEVAKASDLPDFAKKADDLDAIKKAVDDAASVGGGLWLSYLFVLFYLAIAAGAVTHADLFLENPVKLPFLNVELPLLAFFFLAPILFLFVHAYTLVHLVFLTDKAKRFDQALSTQIGDDSVAAKDANDPRIAAIAGVRGQLPGNIFIQLLAGPRDRRAKSFGWLLWVIAWSTLAVAPILLLLLFQIQFLPFHNSWITWTHRLALVADLVLIWWLWRMILSGSLSVTRRPLAVWTWRGIGALLTVCAILFSSGLATFPGEWQTERLADWKPIHERDRLGRPTMVSIHEWLFESKIDDVTGSRRWPFSSTLVLPSFNIYEGLKIDDPDKAKWHQFVFRARGRDLTGAIFNFANLQKVDFDGAELQGASLDYADLQGGWMAYAQLQGASLYLARLQGISLAFAQLQGAFLVGAQLQGALLAAAQLQGADLFNAQLQGASLQAARLESAILNQSNLQGASLEATQLWGASLAGAKIQGASLQLAFLEAIDLSDASLWRTNRAGPFVKLSSVKLRPLPKTWLPLWTDEDYQHLKQMIATLPPGDRRSLAAARIQSLDCSTPYAMFASCDPSLPTPPEAAAWQKALEDADVDDAAYDKALAAELKTLLCSNDNNAIYALRMLLRTVNEGGLSRIVAAGPEAPRLVDFIMSPSCPLSTLLSDDDRAKLLGIKQNAPNNPGG